MAICQTRPHTQLLKCAGGRGSNKEGYSSNWAGAVMQKPPVNAKNSKRKPTGQPIDPPTDIAGQRVA